MLKSFVAFGALLSLFVLTACGSPANTNTNPASTPSPAVVSYDGTWTAEGFVAQIQNDTIEINIVSPDSKALYWLGTFHQPAGKTVVSAANVEKLSMSLLGSQDKTKTFMILDENKIAFDMAMMGVETTIYLER